MVLEPNPKGLSFRVPKADPEMYAQWLDEALQGDNRKKTLLLPIPFACGSLKFTIVRNKSGLNSLSPYYVLYVEKPFGIKVPIMYAQKRKFNKVPNYLISL